MPTITEKMKAHKPQPKKQGPLWAGPEGKGHQGGVTFSMLSRWLSCRERARVRWIEGLSAPEQFNHRIEYGNMWHLCEESLANGPTKGVIYPRAIGANYLWEAKLMDYCRQLCAKYPNQQAEIEKWYNVCKVQFPIYVKHWSEHPETVNRTPLLAEQVFDVPYKLPSGRVVRLRGKWDGVSLVKEKGRAGIWLDEHKSKGDVDVLEIQRQLSFDLQVLTYLVALKEYQTDGVGKYKKSEDRVITQQFPILGVHYNVVRRPLSGGEGSIVQKKGSKNVRPESSAEYYTRLGSVIDGTGVKTNGENYEGPSHWFFRWTVEVSPADLNRFRERCLDPILEAICNWYSLTTNDPICRTQFFDDCLRLGHNYQHPFGVTNNIDEYGSSDLDSYLATGSRVGLVPTTLFRELN